MAETLGPGVHSAVIGMLSLSGATPYNHPGPAPGVGGGCDPAVWTFPPQPLTQAPTAQHHQPQSAHHQHQGLPLTPPGSPPENEHKSHEAVANKLAWGGGHSLASLLQSSGSVDPNLTMTSYPGAAGSFMCTTGGLMELPSTSQPPPAFSQASTLLSTEFMENPMLARCLASNSPSTGKRTRTEKKPIPEDLKDDKYFERRKRNNLAAKKSRDQRKYREDDVAQRAVCLERENTKLRTTIFTLREESEKLRQILLQKQQRQQMEQIAHSAALQQMCNPQSLSIG